MYNPIATYRIQFHKGFTLRDFEDILFYFQKLGVSTIYASPIFQSMPRSVHGYDVLNPNRINSEIGSLEELRIITRNLSQANIGWLQDIVPNHMAFDTKNVWLKDVLEKGKSSEYASFFDVNWNSPVYGGKLMVPFLGSSLEEIINKGELTISLNESEIWFKYFDTFYPLNHLGYLTVFKQLKEQHDVDSLMEKLLALDINKPGYAERFDDFKKSFLSFLANENVRQHIEKSLETINNHKDQLLQLCHQQYYRLCHWQETDFQINYRRFFTVNGLICLNIQDEKVFQQVHQLVKQLVAEKVFKGLRIDHIDGLFDPTQYLDRLKHLVEKDTYTCVEKILHSEESLPANWNVAGNTGYDFLAIVNNLFTNKKYEQLLSNFYNKLVPADKTFEQQLRDKKKYILYEHMSGELENLYQLFLSQELVDEYNLQHIGGENIKKAIGEFLIHCPVYRYYGNTFPLASEEANAVRKILFQVKENHPALNTATDLLLLIFLCKSNKVNQEYNQRALYFYQRCMQFSGPLMAKGFEDTLMYTYNRFLAHNEVGDSPNAFGYTVAEFHDKMKERQKSWPLSINTTSTHDTKRGEDVRARLNILSDLAPLWISQVEEWMQLNKELKQDSAPEVNDEYFIYQTLVGHHPMPGEDEEDFKNRLEEYLQKAMREAKTHSNWTMPNEQYENCVKNFAGELLNKNTAFWKSFEGFQNKIVDFGIINSLIQVLIKFTSPGIPDVYQGTELWDLSFVDPDNRKAVDYKKRTAFLNEIENPEVDAAFFEKLWQQRFSGKIKLWLTNQLFLLRKQHSLLFTEGDYVPLTVKGKNKENIIAFARRHRQTIFIVAAPLHIATLCEQQNKHWQQLDWADTKIILPEGFFSPGKSVLENKKIALGKDILVQNVFQQFPFVVLKADVLPNERGAGILLHISSLPSPFGIGDFGEEAKAFADFLFRSCQKYWQLLPLNPTEAGQGYSPYSSTSSKAGNFLLISSELLAEDGYLTTEDIQPFYLPHSAKADYSAAERVKTKLFDKAWNNFKIIEGSSAQVDLNNYCEKEKLWLNDFALYMIIKEDHGKPWYEWPDEFKFRNTEALQTLTEKNADRLQKIKWLQFIFAKQWKQLKTYCNDRGIQLIGDIPFYISYDSADVWANPEIFKLDKRGNRTGVAGVPPDAFSDDGQLWGMPVFRWGVLKKNNYRWWIERLRKNIELFDLVRLDHFRAFSAYWEVAAKEKTAKKGKWVKGPGAHFFKVLKRSFGELPFIAEDLGEIDAPVYKLRDQFHLPGMKVLQFAFGDDVGTSPHIPHNYKENFFVYTGTHDNNTTRGWWRQEAVKSRIVLQEYVDKTLTEDLVSPVLCRMAYASTARVAILPMQDVLGLDETARMNTPSSSENNWHWRLIPSQILEEAEKNLKEWTNIYNRR